MQQINNARQQSSAKGMAVEQIRARVRQCIDSGTGRTRCRCGQPIDPEQMGMYPHAEGIKLKGMGRQWVYIRCVKCSYCWALWKLHMQLDTDREVASCP